MPVFEPVLVGLLAANLAAPEAIDGVIVDHADRLHERVADSRPDEPESPGSEVLAERAG
jgi:hypothetical protein